MPENPGFPPIDARVRDLVNAVAELTDDAVRPSAFGELAAADPAYRAELDDRLVWCIRHVREFRRLNRSIRRAADHLGANGYREHPPQPSELADGGVLAPTPEEATHG